MNISKCSISLLWLATSLALCGASDPQGKAPKEPVDRPTMDGHYLDYHNKLRERVNAATLVWNGTLAERASRLTQNRKDCRNPPSHEPDINFFFTPKVNNGDAGLAYYNAMDWESYGYLPDIESCPDFFPCDSFMKIARPNVTSVGCCDNPCDVKGTVILCYFSPLLVERPDLPPPGPKIDPQKYVDGFNKLRKRKQVPPLEWNDLLAVKARAYTDEYRAPMACEGVGKKEYGMEVDIFFSEKDDNPDQALDYMMNSIGWEGYAYDPETRTCPVGMECEHFVRIASPTTLHVGCADIQCTGCIGSLIVCYFDPPAA